MNIQIVVALVASVTSLIVAIISLVATIITNKQSAQSATMLEQIKFEYSQRSIAQSFVDTHLEKSLDALRQMVQVLQQFKDELLVIDGWNEKNLESSKAVEILESTRQAVFDCYENNKAYFNLIEDDASHKAKNLALSALYVLNEAILDTQFVSEIMETHKQILNEKRNDISMLQQLLIESRMSRVQQKHNQLL